MKDAAKDLDFDLTVPVGAADGGTVAVLLHGRGSHKGDLQALAPVLPAEWTIVTPQAPNAGAQWGYGPGWAWYRYIAENRVVPETLESSLGLLERFLASLPEVVGFVPGRIVLGGTMSVAYALAHPGEVAVAWNLSGFLADAVTLPDPEERKPATPIFWGHGVRDANIPFSIAETGRDALRRAGVPLVAMDYPIGHWILPEEIHDAVAMVEAL